ncbi:MAG: SpoIIE family protein phosphatase [Desulfamplus sp.]|nr:SpoIIE family protein phosphatase [Desulfamplus sp.]
MKILIVEDDLISRLKLESILSSDDKINENSYLKRNDDSEHILLADCELIFANTGDEAIQIAQSKPHPDLILLDVMLPGMNGYAVCRELKKDMSTQNIPIIFATAKTDEKSEAMGFELGAVDYITKPFRNSIVKNRVRVHLELKRYRDNLKSIINERTTELKKEVQVRRDAQLLLQKANDELERKVEERTEELQNALRQVAYRNQELEQEQSFAENVFTNIINPRFLDAVNIKYLISPLSVFNGDLLLVTRNLAGEQFVILGDFTGHGLRAAIGAIPVSDIFYNMTEKGYSLNDIACEINIKLKKTLPTGLFMCACFLTIDPLRNKLSIWNGGMPDVLIYKKSEHSIKKVPSYTLPLGIVETDKFNKTFKVMDIDHDDRIYIFSDGVVETLNPNGDFFKTTQLEECILKTSEPKSIFDGIITSLNAFRAGEKPKDDITMIEISYPAIKQSDTESIIINEINKINKEKAVMEWKIVLELNASVLRTTDPVPMLMQLVVDREEFKTNKGDIFTVLSEILTNSLDHGILGLESSLKNKPNGFTQYYKERKKALTFLEEGSIKVDMGHIPLEKGGKFIFKVEDTGPGFNYEEVMSRPADLVASTLFSGRGIILLRSLCESLTYKGNGNSVEAVYVW